MFNIFSPEQQLDERGAQHVQAARQRHAGENRASRQIAADQGEVPFPGHPVREKGGGELRPCGMRRVLFIAYRRDLRPAKYLEALAYGRQICAASAAAGGGSADQ